MALQPNSSPIVFTPSSAAGSAAALPTLAVERMQQLVAATTAAAAAAPGERPRIVRWTCNITGRRSCQLLLPAPAALA